MQQFGDCSGMVPQSCFIATMRQWSHVFLPSLLVSHICVIFSVAYFFFEARFRFKHRARHIAGKLNTAADAISCNFSLCPQAPLHPTPIPKVLTDFLMDSSITWTSPHWRALFGDILQAVLHPEPDLHTLQPSTDI